MKIFSRLFKSANPTAPPAAAAGTGTAKKPFPIELPSIGFLNLRGAAGQDALSVDRMALAPLFADIRVSDIAVPRCPVLFLYCEINPEGRIVGRIESVREIIQSARAVVAVVASENNPNHYMKCMAGRAGWRANIVLTMERKGPKLSLFFVDLFGRMFEGQSMLTAWVDLAPQKTDQSDPEAPSTLMMAEAGHVTFKRA